MRVIGAVVASLRPKQWVKNLFVFAGVIFSQQLFTPLFWPALGALAPFFVLSGSMYLPPPLAGAPKDRPSALSGVPRGSFFPPTDGAAPKKDRLHPTKRFRPVASGALPRGGALALG